MKIKIRILKSDLAEIATHLNNAFNQFDKQKIDVATFYNLYSFNKRIEAKKFSTANKCLFSLSIDEYKAIHKLTCNNYGINRNECSFHSEFARVVFNDFLNNCRLQIERLESLMKSSFIV